MNVDIRGCIRGWAGLFAGEEPHSQCQSIRQWAGTYAFRPTHERISATNRHIKRRTDTSWPDAEGVM
jgi:hypothetical protein